MAEYWVNSITGVDTTGNGSLADPYLTPWYALSDITKDTNGDTLFMVGTFAMTQTNMNDLTTEIDTYAPSFNVRLAFISRGLLTPDDDGRCIINADYGIVDSGPADYMFWSGFDINWSITNSWVCFDFDRYNTIYNCNFDGSGICTTNAVAGGYSTNVHYCTGVNKASGGTWFSGSIYSSYDNNFVDMRGQTSGSGFNGSRSMSHKNNVVIMDGDCDGISANYGGLYSGNSFIQLGSAVGAGIRTAINEPHYIMHNYFEGFAYGIEQDSTIQVHAEGNRFYNCTNNIESGGALMDVDNQSLSAALYADASTEAGRVVANFETLAKRSGIINGQQFVGAIQKRQYDAQQYNPFGRR